MRDLEKGEEQEEGWLVERGERSSLRWRNGRGWMELGVPLAFDRGVLVELSEEVVVVVAERRRWWEEEVEVGKVDWKGAELLQLGVGLRLEALLEEKGDLLVVVEVVGVLVGRTSLMDQHGADPEAIRTTRCSKRREEEVSVLMGGRVGL